MLRSRLYLHGWPRPKRAANGKPAEDTVAPLLEEISQTKQVDLYTPLAGYAPGFYINNGYRVLVTNAPDLMPAVQGDWSILRALLERQHGKEQLPYYYTWWKFARWRLLTHTFIPLQAVALVGKPNAGKTTILHLLNKSLGRKANPFQFIVSDTSFNEDLAAATLHLIDDEHSHMDREKQKRLFDYYKWTTVKPSHRVHPKGQKAYELDLIAVPVTACNMDSPDDLKTIPPPFESDMGNRMHIFHCMVAPMPMPTPEEKQAFYTQLESDLPGFNYFLDHEWKMPGG